MSAALELGDSVGKAVACRALGVPRASLYRIAPGKAILFLAA